MEGEPARHFSNYETTLFYLKDVKYVSNYGMICTVMTSMRVRSHFIQILIATLVSIGIFDRALLNFLSIFQSQGDYCSNRGASKGAFARLSYVHSFSLKNMNGLNYIRG